MIEKRAELNTLSVEELIGIIEEKELEIKKLNEMLRFLYESNPKNTGTSDFSYFKQEWSFVTKLVFVLKKANRPLQSSEILNILLKYDKKANDWRNKVSSMGVFLSKAVKYQRIFSHKIPGLNGSYYLLPEWLDTEGKLLPAYLIVPKYR